MIFKGMQVPFELVSFEQMNKKQTKQYFEWFMETLDERISILQSYLKETGSNVILDKTPESLIGLWEWFMDRIEMVPKSEKEINAELEARPEWMHNHVLASTRKFSEQTCLLAYNIAAYFGEVVRGNNPQVYWGYLTTPKKLDGVNAPRLRGYAGNMSSYLYGKIQVCMRKNLREKDKMRLFNLYKLDEQLIYNPELL